MFTLALMPPPLEQWRPIPRYPAYEGSDLGRVRRGSFLLKPIRKTGRRGFPPYLVVNLHRRMHRRQFRLNRLVARAFLPRPRRGCTQVDHVDTDTMNNHARNLEWVTQGENQRRSHAVHPRARDERGRILPLAAKSARTLAAAPTYEGSLQLRGAA